MGERVQKPPLPFTEQLVSTLSSFFFFPALGDTVVREPHKNSHWAHTFHKGVLDTAAFWRFG